jgi:hypothetical protein
MQDVVTNRKQSTFFICVTVVVLMAILMANPYHVHAGDHDKVFVINVLEAEVFSFDNEIFPYYIFSTTYRHQMISPRLSAFLNYAIMSNDYLIEIPTPPPELIA